tara:strand:- start:161 stop:760 length:600 start_codon:yes stop_codon:yes gene_type:complete
MSNLETKMENDCEALINYINAHENKQGIVSMFMKGPPDDRGFMWCPTKGGPNEYWNEEEARGLKQIKNAVLNKGWDSSGYAIMMRKIQKEVEKNVFRNSPPLYDENKYVENPEEMAMEYNDDEGKCDDDPNAGKGSPYYKEKFAIQVAQNYVKTSTFQGMDDNNKKAMRVWANKGSDVAVNYMMHQAGGDYGRMRSMYG